jgi:hypothetical protein
MRAARVKQMKMNTVNDTLAPQGDNKSPHTKYANLDKT